MTTFIHSTIMPLAIIIIPAFLFSGCASTQLNYDAVEVSATVDSVYTREALNNLGKFIDEPYAIPSQVLLAAGNVQTTNTIQPNVTFPFTSMVATATQFAASVTKTATSTIAGAGAGISGTNTAQQSYTTAPLSDSNTLRNQQALYRHAVFGAPLIDNYLPPQIFFQDKFYDDPYYLQFPHCVVCAVKQREFTFEQRPKVRENRMLPSKWLLWDGNPELVSLLSRGEDVIDLGRFGNHELYMRNRDRLEGVLTEFVLHTLSNTEPAEVFTASPVAVTEAPGVSAEKGTSSTLRPSASAPATNMRMVPAARQLSPSLVVPLQIQP